MLEEQSSLGHDGRLTFDDFKLLMLRAGREEDPAQKVRLPSSHTAYRFLHGYWAPPFSLLPESGETIAAVGAQPACSSPVVKSLFAPGLIIGHVCLHSQHMVAARA